MRARRRRARRARRLATPPEGFGSPCPIGRRHQIHEESMIRLRVLPCLVIAACSASPYAAEPAKASRPPPELAIESALATPKGDTRAFEVAPHGPRYAYGAKFEPPDGRRFD